MSDVGASSFYFHTFFSEEMCQNSASIHSLERIKGGDDLEKKSSIHSRGREGKGVKDFTAFIKNWGG